MSIFSPEYIKGSVEKIFSVKNNLPYIKGLRY